jgi:hypothetical protein
MAVLGFFARASCVLLIHRRPPDLLAPPHRVHGRDRRGIVLVKGCKGLDMVETLLGQWREHDKGLF